MVTSILVPHFLHGFPLRRPTTARSSLSWTIKRKITSLQGLFLHGGLYCDRFIHLQLTAHSGGIPGGGEPESVPKEDVSLYQPVSANSGYSWFLSAYFEMTRPSADDPGCTLNFQTDSELLWSYDYGQMLDQHSFVNGSGVLQNAASTFYAEFTCQGAGDVNLAFDNFVWNVFGPSAGAKPQGRSSANHFTSETQCLHRRSSAARKCHPEPNLR